jgi:DNA-binding GntR family transcriptional regulator
MTYRVHDQGSNDDRLTYAQAVERIREWYECNAAQTADQDDDEMRAAIAEAIAGVDDPYEDGNFSDLRDFDAGIRDTVAETCGSFCRAVTIRQRPEWTTLTDFTALRKSLGISANEASEALGLHENYISRVERGDRPYKHVYYLALLGLKEQRT